MHEFKYPPFQESFYRETMDNGLEVALFPKEGFQQTFALFTTRFGSVDQTFQVAGDGRKLKVPDGIAHFLEHKMFESAHMDVFQEFSSHGAAANAFTSFDQTSYLFSSTRDIPENMTILLDYVQEPYFTDENVEKEKGIIGQEIRMYEDNPDSRSFFELRQALFQKHPVRLDIAGTVESISEIDKELLYDCYRTFYHPSNMMLVVSGGFEASKMMEHIRQNQARKTFSPPAELNRFRPEEPAGITTSRRVTKLSVSQPRCLIGWKDADSGINGEPLLRRELVTGLVLDTLFGRGSDLYHQLIDENLIDQQFSWEYECTPGYGYSLLGGNTSSPENLIARINKAVKEVQQTGLSQSEFQRNQKKAIGWFAMALDMPAAIARNYTSYALKDADWFQSVDLLKSVTLDEANRRLQAHLVESQQAASVVLPKS